MQSNSSVMFGKNLLMGLVSIRCRYDSRSDVTGFGASPASLPEDQELGFATSRYRRWRRGSGREPEACCWSASMSAVEALLEQ